MAEAVIGDEFLPQAQAAEEAPSAWRRASTRLTVLVLALVCVGLVIVGSAAVGRSFAPAIMKRLALTGLGLGLFVAGAATPYHWWRRHSLGLLAVAMVGLVAVLIPGVGTEINGGRRWMDLGLPLGFQPSEFAKVAMCAWLAAYCERNLTQMRSATRGFVIPLAVAGLASSLILLEPDFGTAALLAAGCVVMLLVSGTRLCYVLLAGAAFLPLVQRLVLGVPYRLQRVLAFLDPWQDPQGSGYQLIQSKIAIGSGGVFGRGLGSGLQKAGFLPGSDNDFIFSVIAEELGLIGCLAVLLLFIFMLWECLRIVLKARDPFGFAFALGLAWLLGMQAAAHVAVVTGSMPTKGLSLPFISAGGSSLLVSLLTAGILLNIARSEESPEAAPPPSWQDDMPAYEGLAQRVLEAARARAARMIGKGLNRG